MAYLLNKPIVIAAYDPQWPVHYDEEQERLRACLGPVVVRWEHIGSTAVPGLGAKPMIDISASVRSLDDVSSLLGALEEMGYRDAHINARFQRRLFCKGPLFEGTHNLHFTVHDTDTWGDPILLRDYLRAHPAVAAEYQRVKTVAAARHGRDLDGYYEGPEGKGPFLNEMLAAARAWRAQQADLMTN